jgi:peptidoglycan/LPS O-acetylase OafA/YrhL
MAWLVVAGHTALLMGVLSPNNGLPMPGAALRLLQSTDAAVRVFIVLSGFAIANLVISKRQPYGQYITCRAFRIFPVYLLSLFVSLLVVDLYALAYTGNPLAGSGSYQAARLAAQTEHFTPHLLLHLTLLRPRQCPAVFRNRLPGSCMDDIPRMAVLSRCSNRGLDVGPRRQ